MKNLFKASYKKALSTFDAKVYSGHPLIKPIVNAGIKKIDDVKVIRWK